MGSCSFCKSERGQPLKLELLKLLWGLELSLEEVASTAYYKKNVWELEQTESALNNIDSLSVCVLNEKQKYSFWLINFQQNMVIFILLTYSSRDLCWSFGLAQNKKQTISEKNKSTLNTSL